MAKKIGVACRQCGHRLHLTIDEWTTGRKCPKCGQLVQRPTPGTGRPAPPAGLGGPVEPKTAEVTPVAAPPAADNPEDTVVTSVKTLDRSKLRQARALDGPEIRRAQPLRTPPPRPEPEVRRATPVDRPVIRRTQAEEPPPDGPATHPPSSTQSTDPRLAILTAENAELRREIAALRQERDQAAGAESGRVAELLAQVETLDQQLAEERTNAVMHDRKAEALKEQLFAAERKAAEAEARDEIAGETLGKLRAQVRELSGDRMTAQLEAEQARAELETLRERFAGQRQAQAELRQQAEDASSARAALESRLRSTAEGKEAAERELEALRTRTDAQIDALKEDVAGLKGQVIPPEKIQETKDRLLQLTIENKKLELTVAKQKEAFEARIKAMTEAQKGALQGKMSELAERFKTQRDELREASEKQQEELNRRLEKLEAERDTFAARAAAADEAETARTALQQERDALTAELETLRDRLAKADTDRVDRAELTRVQEERDRLQARIDELAAEIARRDSRQQAADGDADEARERLAIENKILHEKLDELHEQLDSAHSQAAGAPDAERLERLTVENRILHEKLDELHERLAAAPDKEAFVKLRIQNKILTEKLQQMRTAIEKARDGAQ